MEISSRNVVEGTARAPHRAMYKAMGLTDDDLSKQFIGVCHTGNEATPCNIHLPKLAQKAKQGVSDTGATPREFSTIAVSDGIAMGHEGMKSSLISREVIADSIELMVRAHQYDALVGIAGCDKSLPGTMMAMARLNIPSVFVYGGTIMPGMLDGKELTVVDVYEAVGAYDAGTLSLEGLKNIENTACPNEGSCGGMFTANTMASISEAIGLALPGSASPPAADDRREKIVYDTGVACTKLLEMNIRPKEILSFEAFENAIIMLNSVGGSTNGILHLLALASEVNVDLTYDDFERIRKKTPHLAEHETDPTGVLLSSSLWEGVDLKDDLSRFQIIAKVPYPNYKEKRTKAKMDKFPMWYTSQTLTKLLQGFGRSIRSEDDWAKTYVLDTAVNNVFFKAQQMIPKAYYDVLGIENL